MDFYTQKGYDADVILFGSFLFEISCGYTMDSPVLHDFDIPADCPKPVKKVVRSPQASNLSAASDYFP